MVLVTSAQQGKHYERVNKRQGSAPARQQPPAERLQEAEPLILAGERTNCSALRRHCHPPAAELTVGSDCETLVSTAAPRAGLALGAPTSWFTSVYPCRASALLASAEKEKHGGKQALEVSMEGSRHPTAPSQLPLLCHELSRDTNCLSKGVACSENELVTAECLYHLAFETSKQKSLRKRME